MEELQEKKSHNLTRWASCYCQTSGARIMKTRRRGKQPVQTSIATNLQSATATLRLLQQTTLSRRYLALTTDAFGRLLSDVVCTLGSKSSLVNLKQVYRNARGCKKRKSHPFRNKGKCIDRCCAAAPHLQKNRCRHHQKPYADQYSKTLVEASCKLLSSITFFVQMREAGKGNTKEQHENIQENKCTILHMHGKVHASLMCRLQTSHLSQWGVTASMRSIARSLEVCMTAKLHMFRKVVKKLYLLHQKYDAWSKDQTRILNGMTYLHSLGWDNYQRNTFDSH